jgi:hypothetical protein
VWWLLLPGFVGMADSLGSEDGPTLLFPLNMIAFGFVFGFFLIPVVLVWLPVLRVWSAFQPEQRMSTPTQPHSPLPPTKPDATIHPNPLAPAKKWDEITDMSHVAYQDYLASEAWRARRRIMLKRSFHKCQVCGASDQLQIHHRTYDRLGNERPEDLTVLCGSCHTLFHQHRGMPKTR